MDDQEDCREGEGRAEEIKSRRGIGTFLRTCKV